MRVNPVEDSAKGRGRGFGRGVLHLDQGDKERGPLDQRADGRGIACSLDQIALPVAGNDTLADLRWAQMDAGHLRNLAPAIFASGARPATLTRLSQAGDQLTAQRAAWYRVKRGVPQGDFLRAAVNRDFWLILCSRI